MAKQNVCVVFDLDDTLYLERDYVQSGFHAVAEWCAGRLGLRDFQPQAQALFDAGRRGDIFNAVLAQAGISADTGLIAEMVRVYREHVPSIALMPDTLECLDRLAGRVHLGLLTDGPSRSQWAKIDRLGLRDRFDSIVVTGDWGAEFSKPHLRGYRSLESRMDACRGRFVYVADNPGKDFIAPKELGWGAIRVRRPGGLHENVDGPGHLAGFEVSNLEPVPGLLAEIFATRFEEPIAQ